MPDKVQTNNEDAIVLFSADEYRALLSLLYELSEPAKLAAIAASHKFDITNSQMARISSMWQALAHNRPR